MLSRAWDLTTGGGNLIVESVDVSPEPQQHLRDLLLILHARVMQTRVPLRITLVSPQNARYFSSQGHVGTA
eukprot:1143797-Rhodomonas_salina.1